MRYEYIYIRQIISVSERANALHLRREKILAKSLFLKRISNMAMVYSKQ